MKTKIHEEAQKVADQLQGFESPVELMVRGQVYKKAMEIDKAMTIYIKPKAWYIPNFLYKAIIKDHVLLVDKVVKE
jgi:hypothetical protein